MMSSQISKAVSLASAKHDGQVDKLGKDYYANHVKQVMQCVYNMGGTDEQITAAILHDVVEDTDMTLNDLKKSFSPGVVSIVDSMTRRDGEEYFEYINRLQKNRDAVMVKIADLNSNLDPAKLIKLDRATAVRLVAKYSAALRMLWLSMAQAM